MANNPKELGTENVRQLLISYSGPAIAAMMASALYNVIDRAFIGQGVCALAISGLAITMPVMNLSAAFGAMIGAGGATLTSIKLGQQDIGSAQKVLGNVFLLNVVLGIIFMALGLIFLDEILYFFGAIENTISYAKDFMQVILIGNVITHLYLGLNSVMRASGHPTKAMRMTFLTVLINLALAPLFIFVFNWGIMGAASATIIAQTVAFAIIMKLPHKIDRCANLAPSRREHCRQAVCRRRIWTDCLRHGERRSLDARKPPTSKRRHERHIRLGRLRRGAPCGPFFNYDTRDCHSSFFSGKSELTYFSMIGAIASFGLSLPPGGDRPMPLYTRMVARVRTRSRTGSRSMVESVTSSRPPNPVNPASP